MYIDLKYYMSISGKKMTNDAFTRSEFRARKIIDRMTQDRIKSMSEIPEAVKMLMVDLITLEDTQGAAVTENQAVSSFSNDGYSETYADPLTPERVKELEHELVFVYLSGEKDDNGTPLLWVGVG